MTTDSAFQQSFVDQALAQLGFGNSTNLWWASAYLLNVPTDVLPEEFFVKHEDFGLGFLVSGKFPYVDIQSQTIKQFTVPRPLIMIAAPTSTKIPSEAWAQGKPKTQLVAGLLIVLTAGPLIGKLLWEGIVEPGPSGKLRMSATQREITAEDATADKIRHAAEQSLPKIYPNANEARLALALRWFHRGFQDDDPVDQFMDFWLSILALVEGFRYSARLKTQRARFRAYAEYCLKLDGEKRNQLVDRLGMLYKKRNDLFHESNITVISSSIVNDAQLLALQLLRAEVMR